MICRFILDNLVGPVAEVEEEGASAGRVKRSAASTILEDGVMEVDGNPRDGRPRREKDMYERYELEQSVQDLSKGRRCPTSHAPFSSTTPCPSFLPLSMQTLAIKSRLFCSFLQTSICGSRCTRHVHKNAKYCYDTRCCTS